MCMQGRIKRTSRKTLPRLRSRLCECLYGLASLLFFLAAVMNSEYELLGLKDTLGKLLALVTVAIPVLFIKEFLMRLVYSIEEYQHLSTRYENSFKRFSKDVFCFSQTSYIMGGSLLIIAVYLQDYRNAVTIWHALGPRACIFSILGIAFLDPLLNLRSGPLYDSLWIENSCLDYGSGMAHSFFHGYLNLVIPKTGGKEKNLEELMRDYEDNHQVKLESYRLFILIPKSLYCPTSLKDKDISPSIEESQSLAPKEITVAGVQNRVYKNSVYKINSDRGKVYVAAEYATPLKTFKDVVNFNGEHSNHYKKHKDDIVLQFYLTLQKVLKENEACTNFCELIFYDDRDEHGRYKDVGQILLNRIKKLQRPSTLSL